MFKIEPDVVKPAITRKTLYPWADMKPGDSFFVPLEKDETKLIAASGAAWCRSHRPLFTCSQRPVEGGVRVWMELKKVKEEEVKLPPKAKK